MLFGGRNSIYEIQFVKLNFVSMSESIYKIQQINYKNNQKLFSDPLITL